MLRRILSTLLVLGSLLFVVSAQDTSEMDATLEEVTSDSASFYGQTITLNGVIIEYLNASSFVLGEDATIDDDRVLVLNNSGDVFPPELFVGEHVTLTGVVYASIQAYDENLAAEDTVDDVAGDVNTMEDTEDATDNAEPLEGAEDRSQLDESIDEPDDMFNEDVANTLPVDLDDMNISINLVDYYLAGHYPEEYDVYTIIEITDIEDVQATIVDE